MMSWIQPPPDPVMSRLPIAREGWPFIAIPGAIALGLALLGRRRLALPFAAAAAPRPGSSAIPSRDIPAVANGVLAPADGRVMSIEDAVDSFVGPSSGWRSSSPARRARQPGADRRRRHRYRLHPGRLRRRLRPGRREQRALRRAAAGRTRADHGVQIAGVVARRIVCRVGSGDKLSAGERFGMIRFGSRTDCYMPRGTEVTVRVGETVRGGQTVIGVLK